MQVTLLSFLLLVAAAPEIAPLVGDSSVGSMNVPGSAACPRCDWPLQWPGAVSYGGRRSGRWSSGCLVRPFDYRQYFDYPGHDGVWRAWGGYGSAFYGPYEPTPAPSVGLPLAPSPAPPSAGP